MSPVLAALLFGLAVTLHNFEEALHLPRWSRAASRWHAPVSDSEFRFAIVVLTAFLWVAIGLYLTGGRASFGAYLTAGYALAMAINVFVPHVLGSVAMCRYIPGTATAVAAVLPTAVLLLHAMLDRGEIELARFLATAPFVCLLLLAAIPALFAIGRKLAAK